MTIEITHRMPREQRLEEGKHMASVMCEIINGYGDDELFKAFMDWKMVDTFGETIQFIHKGMPSDEKTLKDWLGYVWFVEVIETAFSQFIHDEDAVYVMEALKSFVAEPMSKQHIIISNGFSLLSCMSILKAGTSEQVRKYINNRTEACTRNLYKRDGLKGIFVHVWISSVMYISYCEKVCKPRLEALMNEKKKGFTNNAFKTLKGLKK